MPRIATFGKLVVYIYAAPTEHPPPHFHIVGPDTDVAVEIRTLAIMEGSYRPKDIGEVLAWASQNVETLLKRWEEFNGRD